MSSERIFRVIWVRVMQTREAPDFRGLHKYKNCAFPLKSVWNTLERRVYGFKNCLYKSLNYVNNVINMSLVLTLDNLLLSSLPSWTEQEHVFIAWLNCLSTQIEYFISIIFFNVFGSLSLVVFQIWWLKNQKMKR